MSNHSLSLRRRLALEAWRRIKNERRKEHRLTQLMWECTLRCNLKCRHCGSDCHTDALKADMPLKDFLKVLESIKANTNPINITINEIEDGFALIYNRKSNPKEAYLEDLSTIPIIHNYTTKIDYFDIQLAFDEANTDDELILV